jgi:hypothetical protein
VFGWTHTPVSAKATAEIDTVGLSAFCVKPIFVPYSALSGIAAGTYPDITIRPTDPGSALVSGNYYSLDLTNTFNPLTFTDGTTADTNNGANAFNDSWQHCIANQISCNTQLMVKSKEGNLGNNISTDVGQYTDTFVGPGDYDPGDRDTSTSVVAMAVWDDSSQINLNSGTTPIAIKGFVNVFIDPYSNINKAPVTAHFVGYSGCNGGSPPGLSPALAPIRLVQ